MEVTPNVLGLPDRYELFRDSQLEVIDYAYDNYNNHLSSIIQMPTGTGKSVVAIATANKILRDNPNGRVVIVEPTKSLQKKFEEQFDGNEFEVEIPMSINDARYEYWDEDEKRVMHDTEMYSRDMRRWRKARLLVTNYHKLYYSKWIRDEVLYYIFDESHNMHNIMTGILSPKFIRKNMEKHDLWPNDADYFGIEDWERYLVGIKPNIADMRAEIQEEMGTLLGERVNYIKEGMIGEYEHMIEQYIMCLDGKEIVKPAFWDDEYVSKETRREIMKEYNKVYWSLVDKDTSLLEISMSISSLEYHMGRKSANGDRMYHYSKEMDRKKKQDIYSIEFKPYDVRRHMYSAFGLNDTNFMMMSGTMLPDNLSCQLAIDEQDAGYKEIASPWNPKNQEIAFLKAYNVNSRSTPDAKIKALESLDNIVTKCRQVFNEQPGIIFFASEGGLLGLQSYLDMTRNGDKIIFNEKGNNISREYVKEQFRNHHDEHDRNILATFSFGEGEDFEFVRWIVVAKMPRGAWDEWTQNRKAILPKAYTQETVIKLIQMCGRGNRSADDVCTILIPDSSYVVDLNEIKRYKWFNERILRGGKR